jgi:hypothetical protein
LTASGGAAAAAVGENGGVGCGFVQFSSPKPKQNYLSRPKTKTNLFGARAPYTHRLHGMPMFLHYMYVSNNST